MLKTIHRFIKWRKSRKTYRNKETEVVSTEIDIPIFHEKFTPYDLNIKKSIRRLQLELRLLHKRHKAIKNKVIESEENIKGRIEDCQRLMTLFCTLRAHSRGKLHSQHMTFEEQEELIDVLMSLYVAEFVGTVNEVPKPNSAYSYYPIRGLANFKKQGIIFSQLMMMYFDCNRKLRSMRSLRKLNAW